MHGQIPKDNEVWKMRCNLLASQDQAIQNGTVPAPLVAATRGVPGAKFNTFGFDRSGMNQHYVACTMFYLAAIADRAGNGGKVDASASHDALVLAELDVKDAHGQDLTFSEKFKRTSGKATELTTPSLTSAELMAVIDAASTMPLSLNPPPTVLAQKPKAKVLTSSR
jgi:hypothetical protein